MKSRKDVLDDIEGPDWDEATRKAIRDRLAPYALRYFTSEQADLIEAVGLRLIPQDREPRARIRVAPALDKKLFDDLRDGFRFETLPPQRTAFRVFFKGLEETSLFLHGRPFQELNGDQQDSVLKAIESGAPPGDAWTAMSSKDFFRSMLLPYIISAYYEHPTAWNEVGYAGPAARRGHVRTWEGGKDPWN